MPLGPSFAASLLASIIAQPVTPAADVMPPASFLGIRAGASVRLGAVGSEEPPRIGPAFALVIGRRFATVANRRVGVGAQVELGYMRHAKTVTLDTTDPTTGAPLRFDAPRMSSIGDFTVLAFVDRVHGRVRPWAAAGGGLRVGYFSREQLFDPAGRPEGNEGTHLRPVAQLAAGAELNINPQLAVGGRLDLLRTLGAGTPAFPSATASSDGGRAPALRDGLLVSLTMSSRF